MTASIEAIEARADAAIKQARQKEPPPFYGEGDPEAQPQEVAPPFRALDIAKLAHEDPPPPRYLWAQRIPVGLVTMLAAHGGVGKSTLMSMLGIAAASEQDFLGLPTLAGPVLMLSAEDGERLLGYRIKTICRHMSVDPADLVDSLHVLDATEGQPEMFRDGKTTVTLAALRNEVERLRPVLIILDNASDVFADSEIDRAAVRGFMRELAKLAAHADAAVVLIAHVDKATSRGDRVVNSEAYSGSTAWHNSARSRLFLSRDKDGLLRLEHQKCNVGPLAPPLVLTWPQDGIPMLDQPLSPVTQHLADRNNIRAILRLIHEFEQRGEYVTTATTARAHAGKLFGREQTYPRLKDAELFGLLRDAERAGHIERFNYKTVGRKDAQRWRLTASGAAFAGICAPTAPTAPTSPDSEVSAAGAKAAPTAPTSALGGVGERARTKSAQKGGGDARADF
ncbi:AAA family ATPase [Ottowia sp.]|uniref:AAA family ATPase n=1 Tax=Ottowia sp. TaxID=1898956 RepID=UPI002CD7CEBA|nr:AAA family ATPase [Ottowia sp.]HOB65820.1 AAA family ATPase [Ottowia sp.]HPZ57129.1 AAA family ATPase [Ottowia sp.]HQD46816.1 AAA family ATPase [Ottowia sp.]